MDPKLAERLYAVLRSVDPSPTTEKTDRLLARSAGRMLEEAVETALECGLPVASVFTHVADAVHNESRKAGRYPSELKAARGERSAVVGELADLELINDYLRHIAGIDPAEIAAAAEAKVERMEIARDLGSIYVIDGLLYTKRQPNP